MVRLIAALLGLLLLAMGGTAALAQDAEAEEGDAEADTQDGRDLFLLGQRLYQQGEFVEAAMAFERSYEESNRAALLYNVYIAYRDAGQPAEAADALRRYLDEESPDRLQETREVLTERLTRLEEQALAATEPLEPRQEEDEAGAPIAPILLMAGGGAAVILGAVLGGVALGKDSDLAEACPDGRCPGERADDIDQTRRFARTSDALLFGGAAIAIGGVLWLMLGSRGEDDDTPRASVGCDGTGCSATLRGSF